MQGLVKTQMTVIREPSEGIAAAITGAKTTVTIGPHRQTEALLFVMKGAFPQVSATTAQWRRSQVLFNETA
jgi:hypothetical protein